MQSSHSLLPARVKSPVIRFFGKSDVLERFTHNEIILRSFVGERRLSICGSGGQSSHASTAEVLVRLLNLGLAVHYEGAVGHDRLINWFSIQNEQVRILQRCYRNRVAVAIKDGQPASSSVSPPDNSIWPLRTKINVL
jgi:hypothetical protein